MCSEDDDSGDLTGLVNDWQMILRENCTSFRVLSSPPQPTGEKGQSTASQGQSKRGREGTLGAGGGRGLV